MTVRFYVHIAADVWLGKGKSAPTLLASFFTLKLFNGIRGKLACTDQQREWIVILPTYSKDIPFAEIQDNDFRSANKLKQKLDETVEKLDVNTSCFVPEDSKTTEKQHWVCISSVGCSDGIVNLYDSLYHNVISKEVEEQALNLVGADSFSSLNVVAIQQQRNGSDSGVFAAAFSTALVHGVPPGLLKFDTTKLRNHLCEC